MSKRLVIAKVSVTFILLRRLPFSLLLLTNNQVYIPIFLYFHSFPFQSLLLYRPVNVS